jgi:hypothetical protein
MVLLLEMLKLVRIEGQTRGDPAVLLLLLQVVMLCAAPLAGAVVVLLLTVLQMVSVCDESLRNLTLPQCWPASVCVL